VVPTYLVSVSAYEILTTSPEKYN